MELLLIFYDRIFLEIYDRVFYFYTFFFWEGIFKSYLNFKIRKHYVVAP